jgi:surfeit locus 1 family protein
MRAFKPRTSFWIVTVAALLTALLTFSLGQWQLARAAQKLALQRSLESKNDLPVLRNAELAQAAASIGSGPGSAALADRRVEVSGRWLAAQTIYLDNRQMNGRPGFWVLTPLALEGTERVVMVQRGWIARDFQQRTRLAPIETPDSRVTVQGRMAPAPAKLYAFKGSDTGSVRQNLDIAEFSAETKLALVSALVLQTGAASEGLQREWPAPNTGVDKHYGYAVQWFGLCALVLGLYVWFQLILPRRQGRSVH